MKKRILGVLLVLDLCVGTASAQFSFGGIVYDPTDYANAVLRYKQLVQQLVQRRHHSAGNPGRESRSGHQHTGQLASDLPNAV